MVPLPAAGASRAKVLLLGGTGIGAIGIGVAGFSLAQAVAIRNQACADFTQDGACIPAANRSYDQAATEYELSRTLLYMGEGALVAGLGLVGVSFLGAEVGPLEGGGLGLELSMGAP